MFDLTDLTSAVKKTTKKATDFTLKPVQFVTAPLVDMHNKLRKSVFGPDLVFLSETQHKEQYTILMDAYANHLETIKKLLQKNKLLAKKIDAYINAAKLIGAAHEMIKTPKEKIDAMQNLYDELRSICKEYIPTTLKEETFSATKKIACSEEDFKSIAQAISTTKSFLSYCAGEIDDNASQLACTKLPEFSGVEEAIQKVKVELPELQKKYQDELFGLQQVIHEGYDVIHNIQLGANHLKVYENNQKSLFGPEKTKSKKSYENELESVKKLISHDFTNRKKSITNAQATTQKAQKEHFAVLPTCEKEREKRTSALSKQEIIIEKQAITVKKQFGTYTTSHNKSVLGEQNKLKDNYGTLEKALVSPYDQATVISTLCSEIITQHTFVHNTYHESAHHIWNSGLLSEMPVVYAQLALHQRKLYLMEILTFHRQQLFYSKLIKRLRKGIINEVQSYENTIDDNKLYAKETLSPVLNYLRELTNSLQDELKVVDTQITQDNKYIETIKGEIWDTLTVNRLFHTKRTWHNDLLRAMIASSHKSQLNNEVLIHQKAIKSIQSVYKEIEKKHRIDSTAFQEHKKTVQIIKTKDQKEKLELLKTQINNQQRTLTQLHELILLVTTHTDELNSLVKKYGVFAKNHEQHALGAKKSIHDLSKKVITSPLQKFVDCSEKCMSALA